MGYVHDLDFTQFIPPGQIVKTGGSWTASAVSGVVAEARAAADGTFQLLIPVVVPGNSGPLKGARLKSVELIYKISGAAADTLTPVELLRAAFAAGGTAGGAVTPTSLDGGHDTDAKRKAVSDHRMAVTLNTPAWVDDDEAWFLSVTVDAAATTVFSLYGAVVRYELRM